MAADLMTTREAAKAIHKSRAFVERMIERGDIRVLIDGGSPEHPRRKVSLREVQAARAAQLDYRPVKAKRTRRWRPSAKGLHPVAAAM